MFRRLGWSHHTRILDRSLLSGLHQEMIYMSYRYCPYPGEGPGQEQRALVSTGYWYVSEVILGFKVPNGTGSYEPWTTLRSNTAETCHYGSTRSRFLRQTCSRPQLVNNPSAATPWLTSDVLNTRLLSAVESVRHLPSAQVTHLATCSCNRPPAAMRPVLSGWVNTSHLWPGSQRNPSSQVGQHASST